MVDNEPRPPPLATNRRMTVACENMHHLRPYCPDFLSNVGAFENRTLTSQNRPGLQKLEKRGRLKIGR